MPCPPFIILAIFFLILQTSFMPLLPGWLSRLDPFFVTLIFISIRFDPYRGAIMITFFGMLMDIFSGIYSGLHPVAYLCLFLIIKLLSRPLVLNELPHQIPIVLSSYLFVTAFTFAMIDSLAPNVATSWQWQEIIIHLVLLAIITMPLFSFFDFIMAKFSAHKSLQIIIRPKRGNRFH